MQGIEIDGWGAETDTAQCEQVKVLCCVVGFYLLQVEQSSPAPEQIVPKVAFLV